MTKIEMTEMIMVAKAAKGLSWEAIAAAADMSPVFITSCCLGMNSTPVPAAAAICEILGLDAEVNATLEAFPTKIWDQAVPTDPCIYRLYEVVGVYGDTLKEIIQEKFGDGIMSAIDFTMEVEKKENPKGDRVIITMDGKFLKYNAW
ncbi:cyanase [Pseudomonadales bacterium]|nr:cyanase [Pseudomonadales bacterium]